MSRKDFREKLLLIAFAGLVLLGVLHFNDVYHHISVLLGAMNAVIIGGALAFVLNVPMKKLEALFQKIPYVRLAKRPLAILSLLAALVAIIGAISMVIIPTITSTVQDLIAYVSYHGPGWINDLQERGWLTDELRDEALSNLRKYANFDMIAQNVPSVFFGLVNNISGIFSSLLTWILAFFITLSILGGKEHLQSMTHRILQASFPRRVVKTVEYIGSVIVETYDQFLLSQMVEALIIGTLIYLTYSLFGMPYAAMAGVLTGVLSFIPYIGPFTACMVSALFILSESPWLALGSIVIFQIMQLVEGNIIYPRVVGKSVGLPTFFTLAAALIGGSLFGLLGMVFFTPIFAVFYRLVKEWTNYRIQKKAETEEA